MSTERKLHPELLDGQVRSERSMPSSVAPDAGAEPPGVAPTASPGHPARGGVVVISVPSSAATPQTFTERAPTPALREAVHVVPNIRELVTAAPIATPQEVLVAKERRDLNEIVHGVLIVGLIISTVLMLAGVGLDLFSQRELPASVPDIGEVISRVLVLRPSGFLALGLLVLIATPILRVIGSLGAFLYARDWRFAGATTLVLAVLIVSLLLGRG
jgi:uncharacterized membrane protein